MKHTPGPWYYESDGDGSPRLRRDQYVVAPDGLGRVCTCEGENAYGDAHLIAGAPELLDALRALQGWVTDLMGPEGTAIPDNHPILTARAAIAKATGAKPRAEG